MNTQEFFSELYKGVPPEKVTYCYTLPRRKCEPFAVGEMEQLAHRAMELSAAENVYFGLHPMDHAPRPGGRASAEEITGVAFLHGEYDVRGQGHQETRLPETREEVSFCTRWSSRRALLSPAATACTPTGCWKTTCR